VASEIRFKNIEKSAAYMAVADQIRAAILDGSLAAGEGLPSERELAQQFGVSRATVREALRQLQAQGLLAARGRTSSMQATSPEARFREALTHVVKLRDVPLSDLLELRITIEGGAMARSTTECVESHIEEARAALAVMEQPKISQEEFYDADIAFHVALVSASGNQALTLVMLAVKDSIQLHLDQTMQSRSFVKVRPKVVEEHRGLLRAVEQRDARAGLALLQTHLSGFYRT
jgi:DNA-binding FadR family transcriptional regulator